MIRDYSTGVAENVTVFVGEEVEKTPAFGMKTLFVVGSHEGEEIIKLAEWYNCKHIYFGANQSFNPDNADEKFWDEWESMIKTCLKADFWCTLDFDVRHVEQIAETGFDEYRRFIAQISVKIPYMKLLNYNTTIKIDDKGFDATNPGVWCVPLSDLTQQKYFNNWDVYGNDEIIK